MSEPLAILRTLDLPGGSLLPFTSVPGERVRVLCGRVWLTEEGSVRDAFLASGEEVRLGRRGLAVIEALSPARVQLVEDRAGLTPAARVLGAASRRALRALRRLSVRAARPLRAA